MVAGRTVAVHPAAGSCSAVEGCRQPEQRGHRRLAAGAVVEPRSSSAAVAGYHRSCPPAGHTTTGHCRSADQTWRSADSGVRTHSVVDSRAVVRSLRSSNKEVRMIIKHLSVQSQPG